MRRLSLNRSEPAKKSGRNIPKNRCRTTIPERMVETLAELPFIADSIARYSPPVHLHMWPTPVEELGNVIIIVVSHFAVFQPALWISLVLHR